MVLLNQDKYLMIWCWSVNAEALLTCRWENDELICTTGPGIEYKIVTDELTIRGPPMMDKVGGKVRCQGSKSSPEQVESCILTSVGKCLSTACCEWVSVSIFHSRSGRPIHVSPHVSAISPKLPQNSATVCPVQRRWFRTLGDWMSPAPFLHSSFLQALLIYFSHLREWVKGGVRDILGCDRLWQSSLESYVS